MYLNIKYCNIYLILESVLYFSSISFDSKKSQKYICTCRRSYTKLINFQEKKILISLLKLVNFGKVI